MWQLVRLGTGEIIQTYREGPAIIFKRLLDDYVKNGGPDRMPSDRFLIIPKEAGIFLVTSPVGNFRVERVKFDD